MMINKLRQVTTGLEVLENSATWTDILFVWEDFSMAYWSCPGNTSYMSGLYTDENEILDMLEEFGDWNDFYEIPDYKEQTGARYVLGWDT